MSACRLHHAPLWLSVYGCTSHVHTNEHSCERPHTHTHTTHVRDRGARPPTKHCAERLTTEVASLTPAARPPAGLAPPSPSPPPLQPAMCTPAHTLAALPHPGPRGLPNKLPLLLIYAKVRFHSLCFRYLGADAFSPIFPINYGLCYLTLTHSLHPS